MFLYSPLQQFEPTPFFILYFCNIDFSITNITIIFIFIVLILNFFFNGYVSRPRDMDKAWVVLKKTIDSPVVNIKSYTTVPSSFFKYLRQDSTNFFFKVYKNKSVSYLFFLLESDKTLRNVLEFKEYWLDLNLLSLPSLKTEYSREFHRTFFHILKEKNKDILSLNISLFNNIQLYSINFLNDLYFAGYKLKEFSRKASWAFFVNFVEKHRQPIFFNKREAEFRYDRFHGVRFNFINLSFFLEVFSSVYEIILNLVKENIGANRVIPVLKFFPFIFSLFIFILTANIIGLIPYSSTVTSYLIVTFAMAIMVLVGVNVIAGRLHGFLYFGHFLPSGCPFNLYPLIIPIEFISYIFRVVSLSVRLFANMMAGHTLLAVLAGFGWTMLNTSVSLGFLSVFPIFVVFVLVFLETAVAVIQAYVFTILTCMYLDEAINLH